MKGKIAIFTCFLLVAMAGFSFSQEQEESRPDMSAYEHANENAKFKRTWSFFNNKANKEMRAKRLAEQEAEEAAKVKKKMEEDEDKGEGQFKMKF